MIIKNNFPSRLKRRSFWLMLIGLAFCEVLCSPSSPAAPQGGTITQAHGTVFVRRSPQGAWERLAAPKDKTVQPGDALRTGERSHLWLRTDEGKLLLGPNSEMQLVARKRRPAWRLMIGRIANFLYGPPKSDTEAGHVIAAAAGTHYHLSLAEDGTVTLTVLQGAVDFGTAKATGGPEATVRVFAGFESIAPSGQAPRPPVAADISEAIAWEAEMDALSLPIEYPIARPEGALTTLQSSSQPTDWLKAGDILLAQRQYEKAGDEYRRAQEAMPTASVPWTRLAFAHLSAGDAAAAEEAAARALSAAPADPEALTASGAALLMRRKTEDALRLLEQAAASGQPEAMLYAGLAYLRRGDFDKSRSALTNALQAQPRSHVARAYLSQLELSAGDPKAALREGRAALELFPDSALSLQATAAALFYQGNVREAGETALRAVRLDSSLAGAHLALARVYASEGRLTEAVPEAIRAVSLDPEDANAQSVLGALLLTADDLAHAESAFRRAADAAPEAAFARTGLGAALTRQQRFREALSHLQAGVWLDGGSAQAYNNLGALYTAQGRLDEAEKALTEAVRLQPEWGMPYGNLALVYLERNRIREALEAGDKAVRLGERSALLHTVLARIFLKQHRLDRALDELRLAEAEDPAYPLALFLQADIYRVRNQSFDARRASVQGASFDPGAVSELRLYSRSEATVGAGDEQSRFLEGRASGRGDRGRTAFYTRGLAEDSDGYRDANGNSLTRFLQGIVGHRPDWKSQTALQASYLRRTSGRPGRETSGGVEDSDYRSDFTGWQADLTHRQSVGKRDVLLVRAGGRHQETEDSNPDSLQAKPGGTDTNPFNHVEVAAETPALELRWDRDLLNGRRLLAGVGLQQERRSLNGIMGLTRARQAVVWTHIAQSETPRQRSGYVEYRFPVGERTQAAVGGYAGKQTGQQAIALPKARLQYNAPDGGRAVLLLQPVFRADTTLLSPVESWSGPNPIQKDELSDDGSVLSYEAHYERPVRNGSFQKYSLYWRQARGLFVDVEDPRQAPVAGRVFFPKARLFGAEAAYEVGAGTPLSARFWARYEDARDRGPGGKQLPYHPRWQSGVRLDYLDRAGWRAGVEFIGFSRRYDDADNLVSLPGETLAHLRVAKQQSLWTAYFLEVSNLFNRKYDYWRGYPSPGRMFHLGLEQRF